MLGEVPLEPGLQPKPGLQALMLQRLDVRLALAPQQPDVQLAPLCSWGAAGHMTGDCNPCVFFFSNYGCSLGNRCGFCHLMHAKEDVGRPKVTRRKRMPESGRTQRPCIVLLACGSFALIRFAPAGFESRFVRFSSHTRIQLMHRQAFSV
ncbi:unnamed protein product [Durusdinium trenchii]|uniref:C3H1-type domain-containing protein n=1 Tax=Durusdinium trenchii TaxID=1381693 RepID=A0ABP0MBB9_9DINO